MNFNLFTWIREGVKQSVLLGVTDALDSIGTPEHGEDPRPKLLDFVRAGSLPALGPRGEEKSSVKPRRLGRTLKDLEAEGLGAG